MATQLDDKSMIVAITDGIGAHLGKRTRSAFFELAGRLPHVSVFSQLDDSAKQHVLDLLAVSTFYSVVIFPLQAGSSFMDIVHTAGVSEVRMGKDKLTKQFGSSIRKCVNAFYKILEELGIPTGLLSFANLAEFVDKVIAAAEEKEHETLDR